MKGGKTPIHRQPWYPTDYHGDEHVRLLKARRDYRTLTFYRHFIDHSFACGGDLPSDPEALAAIVEMPREDVEEALAFCLGKLVFERGGRLYQKRVIRDIKREFRYRSAQSEVGRKGGKIAGRGRPKDPTGLPLIEDRATPPESIGPPLPTPLPLPAPTPAPEGRQEAPALPPADRAERAIRQTTDALRTKLYGLVGEMAQEDPEHQDPTELMRLVTAYDKPDGTRIRGVVNAALLTHERLERSIADAEAQLAEWRDADGTATARTR